jgi:hypothetical protein
MNVCGWPCKELSCIGLEVSEDTQRRQVEFPCIMERLERRPGFPSMEYDCGKTVIFLENVASMDSFHLKKRRRLQGLALVDFLQ